MENRTNNIKVSVIIPVFNAEPYLRECLDSVLNQTLQEIEIICVNDGSTDGSTDILREYESKDKRVRVLVQENQGAGAARNHGIPFARGAYLSFLDADDFFEPDMLRIAYEKASELDLDVVVWRSDRYIQSQSIYLSGSNINTIRRSLLPAHEPFAGIDIKQDLFHAFVGWPCDKMFRADFIRENGLLYPEIRSSEDLMFIYSAIISAKRIGTIEDILTHIRVSKKGKSVSQSLEKSWQCSHYALAALRDQLKKWNLFDRLERDFINYSLDFLVWHLQSVIGDAFFEMYDKLKKEWFAELGILDKPEDFFYNPYFYKYMVFIINHESTEFLFFAFDNLKNNHEEILTSLQITERILAESQSETGSYRQKLSQTLNELDTNKQVLAESQAESDSYRHKLSQTLNDLNTIKQALAESQAESDSYRQELLQTLNELNTNKQALAESQAELESAHQNLCDKQTALDNCQRSLTDIMEKLIVTQSSEAKVSKELQEKEQNLIETQITLKQAERERDEMLRSNAWKIGSLITFIPGTIKRKLRKKLK